MIRSITIVALLFLLANCSSKPSDSGYNEIPPIMLIEQDGKQISAHTLPGRTILIFFSTGCDHCQREAAQIHNELKEFEAYTLYFISLDSFDEMNRFASQFDLENKSNIKFRRADLSTVTSSLGNIETPTILVFSGDKKLSGRFNGETDVMEIIKVL